MRGAASNDRPYRAPFPEENRDEGNRDTKFPIYRHHGSRRLPRGIRDWELGSCNHPGGKPPTRPEARNHPRRERAVPLLNQEGSPSVRPPWQPVARSIRRFSSVPPCLRGQGWFGGWGRSPLQGSGLMGVPLTQAVGLGFVRSPLWGSKTMADFARLGLVRATFRFLLKRSTKAVVARR